MTKKDAGHDRMKNLIPASPSSLILRRISSSSKGCVPWTVRACGEGSGSCEDSLSALPPFGLLEREGCNTARQLGLTTPVFPGVPSRTRGYYGPRAGELVGIFVCPIACRLHEDE